MELGYTYVKNRIWKHRARFQYLKRSSGTEWRLPFLRGARIISFAIVLSELTSLIYVTCLASKDICTCDSTASSLAAKQDVTRKEFHCLIHHPSDNILPSCDYTVRGWLTRKTVGWKWVCLIPQGSSEGMGTGGGGQRHVDFSSS